MSNEPFADARAEAEKLGIGQYTKHVFLCIGPDCTSEEDGLRSWTRLKKRSAEVNKSGACDPIYRSKVGCLRICREGPIGIVYPDGTWYAGLTPEMIDRVIDEHVVGGQPIESHVIARNPIGGAPAGGEACAGEAGQPPPSA